MVVADVILSSVDVLQRKLLVSRDASLCCILAGISEPLTQNLPPVL